MSQSLEERVVAAIGEQYVLDGEIGRGGMSVVYRARDVRLNRTVAVKVLPPELAYDAAIRTRFTREAQTSAHLSHSHIVPIYDVGERDGIAYFVMGFVTGGNLATLLGREPRQPVDETRRLLAEIADALDYAHLRGVIHRDIKPDNILLDRDNGRAIVTDFGIARAAEAGGGSRLTATGIAVGTPAYMSPEQAMGERELDGRSDVYSLGVLGYQMLTGRVPFSAGNSMALLLKQVTEQPRPIVDLRPDAPKAVREAIERALMKAPEDRWPTAAMFREALTSDGSSAASWRAEGREPVRYTSPVPGSARRERSTRDRWRAEPGAAVQGVGASPPRGARVPVPNQSAAVSGIIFEPDHLAPLTQEQREDLRLWHGRVNLMDRIKAMRGYGWLTLAALFASFGGIAGAIDGDIPPLILAPLVPIYMGFKLWRRGKSLRKSGLRLRRVILMPRAKWVIPAPQKPLSEQQLEKLAPREILDSRWGTAIRRAAEDRTAILDIVAKLSKADRALLPDVAPTTDALVERVAHLAQLLYRLDQGVDTRLIQEIDARIATVELDGEPTEGERRLALLRRQRDTLEELKRRRVTLVRQLDSAGLALGNLRLDLIKLRSSGLQSALSDVSSATQEARALSREIGLVLDAAAEVRTL
ncbi:MAG TPA: serine/threonine-protein kinase [Gemmatimonadaceae bacterium]|nr:serine/threonine-protein kinase [Gemmatimonadaceae bacterium]